MREIGCKYASWNVLFLLFSSSVSPLPWFKDDERFKLSPKYCFSRKHKSFENSDLKTTQTNASVNHVVTKLQLDAILDKDVYQHFVRMKFRALRTHSSVFSYSLIYYY